MSGFVLMIIVIVAGFYFRTKFDINYTLPVLRENKNLALLTKVGGILLAIAIASILLGYQILAIAILLTLAPFFLYLHFKTYGLAIKKFLKRKEDHKP